MNLEAKVPYVARVGVVETIYHQAPDAQPISFDHRYGHIVAADEQPYSRKLKAGSDWTALDCGWLQKASVLQVVNEEGRFPQTVPTDEERIATAAKVVELGCGTADGVHCFALVHPGHSARFEPADVKSLHVRCRSGEVRLTVNVLPG